MAEDSWVGVGVVLALLLVSVPAASVAGATGADTRATPPGDRALVTDDVRQADQSATLGGVQIDPDDVLLRVHLQADGDASWAVVYRIRLDNQNTTEAFEDLQQDIQQNPKNYTSDFKSRMQATARAAENTTGREMGIQNVTVTAQKKQLPQEYGVITYRFTWTNFAAVQDARLRAGDALEGLFLDQETTLLFSWPETYRVVNVTPEPTEERTNAVVWSGPLEFSTGEPSLVLTSEPATTTTSPSPTAPPSDGDTSPVLLVAALLLLVLGAGGFYAYRSGALASLPGGGGEGGAGAGEAATEAPGEGEPGAEAGAEAGAAGAAGAAGETEREEPPEELLSNEEQVLRLLEEHGGRMKQQDVVQELDWTEAKTSQVIGKLRENDEIETFRVGRENVLTLPEESEL